LYYSFTKERFGLMQNSIDLGLIGNGAISALIDAQAEIVWCCMPRFDADPVFCSLLKEHNDRDGFGYCSIELLEQISTEQSYSPNTEVLVTRLADAHGALVEVSLTELWVNRCWQRLLKLFRRC